MGLAEGPNVRYIDKNEVVNLFGYGINLAKRVCDAAEEGQILVAEDFAKDLLNKKHISGLVSLSEPREIKHGQKVVVYNYHEKGKFGRKASELSE
jgi:class 3 adenylate cyclase